MSDTPNLVTIRGGLTLVDAGLIKLRLERAGIFCYLANQYASQLGNGRLGLSASAVWVQVSNLDEERAREIIDEQTDRLSEIDDRVLEDQAEETENCPVCGSDRIEYAAGAGDTIGGECHNCGAAWTL